MRLFESFGNDDKQKKVSAENSILIAIFLLDPLVNLIQEGNFLVMV